jgi:hypothetical protein
MRIKIANTKKAQIKMAENITIIVIISFLFMFGIIFYYKISTYNMKKAKEEMFKEQTLKVLNNIVSLEEISCTNQNIIIKGCVDYLKLNISKELFNRYNIDYRNILGLSFINLTIIYPKQESFILYSNIPGKNLRTSSSMIYIPILVKDVMHDKNYFGILNVRVYKSS